MSEERVVIDLPRSVFDDSVLAALEKDNGTIPICGEIIRICKIRMEKLAERSQRMNNLSKTPTWNKRGRK